jgi:type 1 fimbria pilin
MTRLALALPLILAAAFPSVQPAAAQITAQGGTPVTETPRLLDATDPARVADLIRAAGYRAVLDTTDRGNPVIDSSAEGANFSIYLIECDNGADCWAVHYVSSFTLTEDADLAVLNDWNIRRTIGQAGMLDARAVQIGHYQTLRHGVSEENFLYMFDQWRIALRDYMVHIGFRR